MGLVVTLKSGEALQVGEAVITVTAIGSGKIKVHIDAPREVEILRATLGPEGTAPLTGIKSRR